MRSVPAAVEIVEAGVEASKVVAVLDRRPRQGQIVNLNRPRIRRALRRRRDRGRPPVKSSPDAQPIGSLKQVHVGPEKGDPRHLHAAPQQGGQRHGNVRPLHRQGGVPLRIAYLDARQGEVHAGEGEPVDAHPSRDGPVDGPDRVTADDVAAPSALQERPGSADRQSEDGHGGHHDRPEHTQHAR